MGWDLIVHAFVLVNFHKVTVSYLLTTLSATLTILVVLRGCKFKDTAKVDYFPNECVAVDKIVDMAVFEMIKVCGLWFLLDDDWQNLRCIQLGWGVEVDLA